MMQKRMLLALLLAVTMLLTGCSLIVKDEAVDQAREVLRLGDIVYTKGEVQAQVDQQLYFTQQFYSMYMGQYIDVNDPELVADAREVVIQSLTQEAVITAKAREFGLDVLSAEEQTQLEQAVQSTWTDYRASYEPDLPENATAQQREAAIDRLCEQDGVSLESIRASETIRLLDEKLQAHVIKDVQVTEEELAEALESRAAADKEEFDADLTAYANAVSNGETVYYRPAGFRNVRQILVQFSDADTALMENISVARNKAVAKESAAIDTLTGLGVANYEELASHVTVQLAPSDVPTASATVQQISTSFAEPPADDVMQALRDLGEARALMAFYSEQLDKAEELAAQNVAQEADMVLAALANGESWDALRDAHNDDPGMMKGSPLAETGYPVCAGSTQYDPAFVAAAMSIPEVGGWSDKALGVYGYYIVQYTSDVPAGPVPMDDVREALSADLLAVAQDAAYNTTLKNWVAEADVKVDLSPLDD